jgi:DinB superfamily
MKKCLRKRQKNFGAVLSISSGSSVVPVKEIKVTTTGSTDLMQARQCFDQSRARVVEAAGSLSKAQWQFKPAPDRWSIAENLEHMVAVQERILGPIMEQLMQAPAPPPEYDRALLDGIVLDKIPDRSIKAQAPDHIKPTGEWAPEAALDRLSRNYERLLDLVESRPDLRDHIVDSPPLRLVTNGRFTMMDGYQWVLAVAAHDERHVRQILEVKADPNYPA